ncbi:hypothetical protein I4U23_029068 [Adineta vaga]|nr:hypothetical protein I4U23_029068 [Adineta vaga]
MFPSANYFRDIPCPFFSRVACPRPHCHFKHVQASSQSNVANSIPSSSSINIPPDANETLNKLITQLSTAAAASSISSIPTATNPVPTVDITSIFQNTILQSLTTAFTNAINSATSSTTTTNSNDISEKLTQAISTITTQLHQHQNQPTTPGTSTAGDTVPEYRPTPLVELERRKRNQQQTPVKSTKNDVVNFDSDEYAHATFSPPSSSPPPTSLTQSESVEAIKSKVPTLPQSTQSTSSTIISKQAQSSLIDDKHCWITPPVRRKLSSSSDHNDFDERKLSLARKAMSSEQNQTLNKPINKPTATVKPNVIENTNKSTVPHTNPMLKRIPKKIVSTSKVRVLDIDLDKVPISPSISFDNEPKAIKKPISTALKRPTNGTNEVPPKKPKVIPSTKQNITTIDTTNMKKTVPISNGNNKTTNSDEDDELALFDQVFLSPKKVTPVVLPTAIHQLTSRYSSSTNASNDTTSAVSANRTRAETSTDGRRIAHQPKVHSNSNSNSNNSLATPSLHPLVDPNSSMNKIPFKTRQEYLTFFSNELKKRTTTSNVTTPTASMIARAQTIEKDIFDKSTNKNSYLNLAAKYLRQLRSEDATNSNKTELTTPKKSNPQRLVVSHSAMLTSGNTDNLSFGIKKQKEIDMKTLTENELYTFLLIYKASEKDLIDNGYPAFSLDFPDKVLIKNKNPIYNSTTKIQSSDPNIRTCCRCSKTYRITNEGGYVKQEECIYHWGRIRTQRVAGQIDKNYSCCSSKTNTVGCVVAQYHVNDSDDTGLLSGYVKTQLLRKQLTSDESYGIFALDCEMCYTINGLELVRVSVVNHKLQSVYETLVKPHQQVLDYNTRWSGITEAHLKNCNVTIEDVQRRLLKLFNNKSILIGHSLESDLKALKVKKICVFFCFISFVH